MKSFRILALAGDGSGPEIVEQAGRVLSGIQTKYSVKFTITYAPVGGASVDRFTVPLTEEVLELALKSDAVLLGAVGGPKWEGLDYSITPERALLSLRKEL